MTLSAHIRVRKEPYYRREALEHMVKRAGFTLVHGAQPGPGNILVTWNRKPDDEPLCAAYEKAGGKVIVVENGYLQRVDKTMYALSLTNHHTGGPVGHGKRFPTLGFEVKPWRHRPGGPVLVCAQRGIGRHGFASPPQWAEKHAQALRKAGFDATVRPHPGNSPPKVPLVNDLAGCQHCAVWSSNAGVLALVEGWPVSYAAPHWICREGATTGIWNLGFGDVSRARALEKMAWSQWHHEELATGEPLVRLLESAC